MTITTRRVLLVLALIGLAASVASLWVHVQMLARPGYTSFCDVNATVSCTTVYQSAYSTVRGVPVALFGAGYFVLVLVLLAGSAWGWPDLGETVPAYVFVLSTIGLGASLYLAYASFFVIKAVCLMCLTTYAAVLGLFVVSGARTPFPMTSLPSRFARDARAALARPSAMAVLVVFVAAAAGAVALVPKHAGAAAPGQQVGVPVKGPAERKAEFLKFWESQPRAQVPVPAEGAAVLIVKFSDFQCPACASSYKDAKPILEKYAQKYPGAVRVVTKDFPLERECNVGMTRDLHFAACEAAAAVRMAREKGRGDAMEDWLYTNHAILTPGGVRQAARDIAGVTDFDAPYAGFVSQIKTDIALATILNIRVTPTFYFNGIRIEGGLPPEYLELALDYELKRAGKLKP